ncbi:hypothetical protein SERLA73DRAFT_129336 [Serpula lacrymans var. lacrymans S7.3]|uniref:Uncharacterized protein n=1 Tax=Serpula lacrymans var. lacrymans (strain S7.3) TaxID=936435 RepID=F8PGG1_SERL3|nr:hypothetical protein SERLA73DRAFT_129336 [Serpula lacrymans var. lacrymans S7.3]
MHKVSLDSCTSSRGSSSVVSTDSAVVLVRFADHNKLTGNKVGIRVSQPFLPQVIVPSVAALRRSM